MQRVDHSMIFVLVAGTTTPIAIAALDGGARIAVLSILLATVAAVGYGVYAVGLPAWQKLQAEQATLAEALEENQSSYREEFQRLEQSVSDQFANFDGVDRGALNRLEVDIEAAAIELNHLVATAR